MTTIRVLLVDDHPIMTDGLRLLIDAETDMKVVGIAGDGTEAVRRSTDTKPDVVVMDQSMPGMNGTEATRVIRATVSATRVLMLSMHSDAEHVQRALQAGANGYVLKSCAADELVAAIRAVHAGGRYLSPRLSAVLLDRADFEKAPPARPSLRQRRLHKLLAQGQSVPLSRLSVRELQVLKMLAQGQPMAGIAARLSLSRNTVETYRRRGMAKLGLRDIPALVKFALEQGIIGFDSR